MSMLTLEFSGISPTHSAGRRVGVLMFLRILQAPPTGGIPAQLPPWEQIPSGFFQGRVLGGVRGLVVAVVLVGSRGSWVSKHQHLHRILISNLVLYISYFLISS